MAHDPKEHVMDSPAFEFFTSLFKDEVVLHLPRIGNFQITKFMILELIAAGLILSGGIAVLRVSPGGPAVWAAATVSTAVILCWPRLHPLVLFAAGGALFGLADAIGLW